MAPILISSAKEESIVKMKRSSNWGLLLFSMHLVIFIIKFKIDHTYFCLFSIKERNKLVFIT